MKYIIVSSLFLIATGFIIIVQYRIKRGKIKLVDTYSYHRVIKRTALHLLIAFFVLMLVLLFSKSLELTMTLATYILVCIVGGFLFGLVLEYQTKRRGGKRIDRQGTGRT